MLHKKLLKNTTQTRILWSTLNTIVMLGISFFLLSTPYILPDEFALIRYSSITKNLLLDWNEKPDTNRFLFINVAWDRVLVPKPDPDIADHSIGVEPVTDRAKLIGLLHLLKNNPTHQFIVFDIYFKGSTAHDSLLTELLNSTPNLLVSYHRDENDKPEFPDLKIKKLGLSDIETTDDKCLKFKIFYNDSIKTTPLLLYEQIHKKMFEKKRGLFFLDQKPILNSFILDYKIRNFHYANKIYPKVHLGEWISNAFGIYAEDAFGLENNPSQNNPKEDKATQAWLDSIQKATQKTTDTLPKKSDEKKIDDQTQAWLDSIQKSNPAMVKDDVKPTDFEADFGNLEQLYDLAYLDTSYANAFIYPLLKDKIIFVGDFEDRDMHETIYGKTPGPIILLNAFLALEAGDNVIQGWFLVYLFIAFWFISYMNFTYEHVYMEWIGKLTRRKKTTAIEALTLYLIYFGIVSIVSFFLFNMHVGVLVLAFYIYLIDKIKDFYLKRQAKMAI